MLHLAKNTIPPLNHFSQSWERETPYNLSCRSNINQQSKQFSSVESEKFVNKISIMQHQKTTEWIKKQEVDEQRTRNGET